MLVYMITIILLPFYIPEIENEDNWHGKSLGGSAEGVIAEIQKKIVSQKVSLSPQLPASKLKPNDISNIRLSEAPNYKKGDMVKI